MKYLEAIKEKQKGTIRKMENYFPVFDFHFERIQNQPLNLLEIGVQNGGSLFTWQKYFPQAAITGIDIDSACKQYEQENIKVFIGDQADVAFLKSVNEETGPYDIVIDDGGHTMNQQITSFRTLFPFLKDDGIYVIEDLHTSYWPEFFDSRKKTVEMLKDLIDELHFWARESERANRFLMAIRLIHKVKNVFFGDSSEIKKKIKSYFSENILSLHFYNGIVFIKKGKNQEGKIYKS